MSVASTNQSDLPLSHSHHPDNSPTDRPLPPLIITDPSALDNAKKESPLTLYDSAKVPDHLSVETSSLKAHSSDVSNLQSIPFQQHNDPNNPFAFTPEQLIHPFDPKNVHIIEQYGGVEGICKGLHTNANDGLSTDETATFVPITLKEILGSRHSEKEEILAFEDDSAAKSQLPGGNFSQRIAVFGTNVLPDVKSKSLLQIMWIAMHDKILILLTIAAIVSLGVGLYEDLGIHEEPIATSNGDGTITYTNPPDVRWVEGVAIIVAIMLVVLVGSVNDWQKEKQFRKLNAKKEDRKVKATRSGVQTLVSVHDIQVGDILHLEPGDIVAADGIFIDGHNLQCDESAATGESDAVKKLNWRECLRLQEQYESQDEDSRSISANSGVSRLDSPSMPSTPVPDTPADGSKHLDSRFQYFQTDNQFLAPPSPVLPTPVSPSDSEAKVELKVPGRLTLPPGVHLPDPFIISGSKVVEGDGRYVVTGVGVHSLHGKTMMFLRKDAEITPLQVKLNDLAERIAKLGGAAALLMLLVLLIKYFVGWKTGGVPSEASAIVFDIMQILIATITIVVVAVPEGLPLAVTLALAYATQRMIKDNNLVRVLAACETMGNATTVCSDKTGTLTQNKMTVVAGTLGSTLRFLKDPPESRTDLVPLKDLEKKIASPVLSILNQGIAINTTAFESRNDRGEPIFVGSTTETALLAFAQKLGLDDLSWVRKQWEVQQRYPFSSTRKSMATVIKIPVYDSEQKLVRTVYRAFFKGASEVLVERCGSLIRTSLDLYKELDTDDVEELRIKTRKMTPELQARMNKIIQGYAIRSLRTIALCWRDFDTWPPTKANATEGRDGLSAESVVVHPPENDQIFVEDVTRDVAYEELLEGNGLNLIGIVGIEDPLREGVKDAVEQCTRAGIVVRMVTGDNIFTARSIAKQCGIYTPGGKVMEGPEFRNLSHKEMLEVIPQLQVLARSSPEDKRILVATLKEMGEVVAVTGDGTNDGPALRTADIGFSMGIIGTEVAKEASSIVLMDDNFSSIVKAVMWGRCVNDSVKKFLQFQLTVNVTAVFLAFISAVSDAEGKSVLTATQLLWVNLIMDTFAALALATDPPTPKLLERAPESRKAPLITLQMWKMIIGQSIFQLVITLILYYGGDDILGYKTADQELSLQTLVFNTFVFAQIFNEVNCRSINNNINVFKNAHKNVFFVVIFFIMVLGQVVIVQFGGLAFQTTSQSGVQWAIALVLGFFSLPIGVVIRLIPDDIFKVFFRNPKQRQMYLHPDHSNQPVLPSSAYLVGDQRVEWNASAPVVNNQLDFFRALRSGRGTLGAATVFPSLLATSFGAAWSTAGDGDPTLTLPGRLPGDGVQHGSISDLAAAFNKPAPVYGTK